MESERQEARFLLVDTCGGRGVVALTEGDAVVAEAAMPGRSYSERLVMEGMRLLREQEWKLEELSALVVVTGPGSFTGVRVGLSAVKGWSEAAGVPVIAVSRLNLLVLLTEKSRFLLGIADGKPKAGGDAVFAVLDAGRGEFYCGEYRGGACVREVLQTREEMLQVARSVAVCEPEVAQALREISPVMMTEPGVAEILRVGWERFAAGEFADVATLDANYVRRSDAEIFAKQVARPGDKPVKKPGGKQVDGDVAQ